MHTVALSAFSTSCPQPNNFPINFSCKFKSSALLSSSSLPFTSTPPDPGPLPSSPSSRGKQPPVFSAGRRKAPASLRRRAPTSAAPVSRPALGRLPATASVRKRHFRIPGASALPVRSPPRALRRGRSEPGTRWQRGCGPSPAGVVPGRGSESLVPPREPVGQRSGHTRKWRGTRAARLRRRPGARRWSASRRSVACLASPRVRRLARAGRQLGFDGRRSGCAPGVDRLRGRLGCGGAGVKGPSPPVAASLPTPGQVRRAGRGEVAAGRGGRSGGSLLPLVGLPSRGEVLLHSLPADSDTFLSVPLSGSAAESSLRRCWSRT